MFNGPEIWIVLAVILLLFGGSQLPKLARNLGKAQKEFKDGLAEGREADDAAKAEAAKIESAKNDSSTPTDPPS
jgi:sec-independent protein translocase protein TatA